MQKDNIRYGYVCTKDFVTTTIKVGDLLEPIEFKKGEVVPSSIYCQLTPREQLNFTRNDGLRGDVAGAERKTET